MSSALSEFRTAPRLEDLSREVFDRLEHQPNKDHKAIIDDYVDERLKKDAMVSMHLDGSMYDRLSRLLKAEFLPAYNYFNSIKNEIEERNGNRAMTVLKYVGGTALALELLEAIVTRGKAFRLTLFTVPINLAAGYFVYRMAERSTEKRINKEKERLFTAMSDIDKHLQQNDVYESVREINGDTFLTETEITSTLSKYDDPAQFWSDYHKVKTLDPSTPGALEMLGVPRFSEFLQSHCNGRYAKQMRCERFNELFLKAHETFAQRYGDVYVDNTVKKVMEVKL
jgi:hypothetical protein